MVQEAVMTPRDHQPACHSNAYWTLFLHGTVVCKLSPPPIQRFLPTLWTWFCRHLWFCNAFSKIRIISFFCLKITVSIWNVWKKKVWWTPSPNFPLRLATHWTFHIFTVYYCSDLHFHPKVIHTRNMSAIFVLLSIYLIICWVLLIL